MTEEATTLAGREETHGRPFPHLAEKAALLLAIALAILAGRWLWAETGLDPLPLWGISLCVLPLATLMLAEVLARIVQRLHVGRD